MACGKLFNGMPQMEEAFNSWDFVIELKRIDSAVDEFGRVTNTYRRLRFQGVIQPMSPEALMLKPEAQRGYEWLQIHVGKGKKQPLEVGDVIDVDDVEYRVNARINYTRNGYIEYHCVRRLDVD